jgi:ArsR family transcriptional regulator, repressor of sdpIR and other operons
MQSRRSPAPAAFRALADDTRRNILEYLRGGPRTSGEIADQFHSSWPTISRHLSVLRAGGLVVAERRGQAIYYELNTSVFEDLVQHVRGWSTPARGKSKTRSRERLRPAASEAKG